MKKYNTRKRATYKQHTRKMSDKDERYERYDALKRIHITPRYDTHKHTEYVPVIFKNKKQNTAQRYVDITNAMNDIFPEINAPHNKHTHIASAPYKQFIPTRTDFTAPEDMNKEYIRTTYRREQVKCIIYSNDGDRLLHYGIFIREIYIHGKDIEYTLHRSDRQIQVKPYIPFTRTINGVDIDMILQNKVEIYRI